MLHALLPSLRSVPLLAVTAGLAVACGFEEGDGLGDTLLVPADVELHWDAAYNTDQSRGAVVPVDIMVYDGATGEPREGIEVELDASSEAYVLLPGDLSRVDPEQCEDCALFWDTWRDQAYAVDVDLDAGPARVRTDAEGIARLFVLVDAMGDTGATFIPVSVAVETRDAEGSFSIVANN